MPNPMQAFLVNEYEALRERVDEPLRAIAKHSVKSWFNRERLDQLLRESIGLLQDCELIYAIDADARQVSSNIYPRRIDAGKYGQDLSRRPFAVSMSVLNNAAFHGAFLCDAYLSQATRRPCVTVMYGVTSGQSLLGYIAADFLPRPFEDSLSTLSPTEAPVPV